MNERRAYAWLSDAYVLAAIATGTVLLAQSLPQILDILIHRRPTDAVVDWTAARAFWAGENPYKATGLSALGLPYLGHPPTTPFWFLALAELELKVANGVLGLFVILCLGLHAAIVTRELDLPSPRATAWMVVGAALSTRWMISSFNAGQTSELIATFVVLGWAMLRVRKDLLAGVAIGLACTIKFYPGLMVLLLLLERRWRALLGTVVSFAAVAIFMTVRYGATCWVQFFRQESIVADLWMSNIENGSIHGVVLRLFQPFCGAKCPILPWALVLSCLIALGIVVAAWKLWRRTPQGTAELDICFALFSVIATFTSPWTWDHYNAMLIFPLGVVARESVRCFRDGAIALAATWAASASATVVLLALDRLEKIRLRDLVLLGHREAHLRMHMWDAINWLPMVLLIAALGALLTVHRRPRVPGALPTSD